MWTFRKRERLSGLADLLELAKDAAILDIGCHRGLIGYEFVRHGATLVHGVDFDSEAIKCARTMFYDLDCESKFLVYDLKNGPDFFKQLTQERYDITLMLGTYHKLRRVMTEALRENLIFAIIQRSRYFAWNGYPEEIGELERVIIPNGGQCVHRSSFLQNTAVWSFT